jgi:glutamate-1-semialdehyde 2,1-aminomutase
VPVAAAAGVATLRLLADGKLGKVAQHQADKLRTGLNAAFASHGISGIAYGRSSILKTYLGEPPRLLSGDYSSKYEDGRLLRSGWGSLARALRQSLILGGVDIMGTGGYVSVAHSDEDIEQTVRAFDDTLNCLKSLDLV